MAAPTIGLFVDFRKIYYLKSHLAIPPQNVLNVVSCHPSVMFMVDESSEMNTPSCQRSYNYAQTP